MKRCPECRRDYVDDTLLYCLEDGLALVQGSVTASDEPQTAILSGADVLTHRQIQTTDRTVMLPGGLEAEPQNAFASPTERPGLSAHRAAKPLIAFAAAIAILAGGFFGYRYFNAADTGQINSIAVLPFE